jgi:hypothetical protein
MVRNRGSGSHFDTIDRLHRQQPEAAVEFIKGYNVIKRGAALNWSVCGCRKRIKYVLSVE